MIVIAHRGSSQVAPENTMPAIRKAIRDGADAVEIDVQLTKDQQIVVIHDEWLNRTTNGQGFICDSTYAYIQRLDAGSKFHRKFKDCKVPLLEEVLNLAKPYGIDLHVELKNNLIPYPGLEEKVTKLIQEKEMEAQVILSSFRKDSLERCKQIAPHIRRGYLVWGSLPNLYESRVLDNLKLYSIHPSISLLDSKISRFKQKGHLIFPYVVERKKELSLCHKHQVDGLFTNCPGRVKQLLSQL
jgi:glycerophosphoryl diester phosphodiesterase